MLHNELKCSLVVFVFALAACVFYSSSPSNVLPEKIWVSMNDRATRRSTFLNIPHLKADLRRKQPWNQVRESKKAIEARKAAGWKFGNSSLGQKVGWTQRLNFDCASAPSETAYKKWADNSPLPQFKMSLRQRSREVDFRKYCAVELLTGNVSWRSKHDIRIDQMSGDGVVVILPNQFQGHENIYHSLFWNLDLWCTVTFGELIDYTTRANEHVLILRHEPKTESSQWARDLLFASVGHLRSPMSETRPLDVRFAARVTAKAPVVPNEVELWDSFGFRFRQAADHISTILRQRVKNALRVRSRAENNGTVLLLLRSNTRMLFDVGTRTASAIYEALVEANLPVEVECFDSTFTFEQQVRIFARAAVVISVHGAQLTNIAWMNPHSVVLEVTLRYGWCNDPWVFPPEPPCAPYHKSDFANMARFFNIKYQYFDPDYIGCRGPDAGGFMNPIVANGIYVNSEKLAIAAQNAHRYATNLGQRNDGNM